MNKTENKIEKTKNNENEKNNNKNRKVEKIDVTIFLIIFIIFGFALLSFYPGIITPDGVDQINQAQTNNYSTGHPIIDSFLVGNLTKIAGNIWLPALCQIIIFAFIWTYSCKLLRKYNNTRRNKTWQVFITLIISILPLNYMYSITIWKDIIYSYMFFLLIIMIYMGIKEKFNYSAFQIILISLSSVCIMKFRYNGAPIGAIMLLIVVILNFIYNKKFKDTIKFAVSFVLIMIIMCIPQWTVNIMPTQSGGTILNTTKVYCIGALLKYDNIDQELTNDEREFLDTILDVEKWKEIYDPYFGTYIFYNEGYNNSALLSVEANQKMDEIFKKYASQHKKTIIKHFLTTNSIWWQINENSKTFMNCVVENNDYILGISDGKYKTTPISKIGNNILSKWYRKTITHRSLYYLIYRPATALYISIILLIAIIIKNKRNGNKNSVQYLLLILPMILNIGTYILLITSQDQRYFYPNFMTEYSLILIYGAEYLKARKVEKYENYNLKNKKNPKVLVIVPAYNESKSLKNVVEDIKTNTTNADYMVDYIIINDSSKDNTIEVCNDNNLNVISLPVNYGLSSGIQIGMKYALKNDYDIAIQFDGDGQHEGKYLNDIISKMIKDNDDIVIGSRFVTEKKPLSARMLGSRLITSFIKLTTGKKITDPTSGMRAFNKNAMKEMVNNSNLTPEPDTIDYFIIKGFRIDEVQVEMRERQFGKSYLSFGKSITYMANVIFSIIFMSFFTD